MKLPVLRPDYFTKALKNLPERSALSVERRARLESAGWQLAHSLLPSDLRWWEYKPHRKCKLPRWLQEVAGKVFDHHYRLVHQKSKLTIHVGEPYHLPSEKEFDALCAGKYKYRIVPGWSLHCPRAAAELMGTTAVWFYEVKDAKAIEKLIPKGDD